jgi:dolichyl-phosphate beta-glucosyltransferase
MKPEISIVIPAYNEEQRIEKSLVSAVDYLNKESYDYEILVVDDGSSDRTVDIAENFGDNVRLLRLPRNMGKGAAVRTGMMAANGRYRIFTDADFSTPIYEIKKVMKHLTDGADVCIGSRALNPDMIRRHQPFYREFMGKTFNKIVQKLLFKGIKDTQCGFKGFTEEAAQSIFPEAKIDGFSFDVEILYLANRKGLVIEQVPVEWYNDNRSTVDPVKDSIRMLVELFKIKNLHKGMYD